MMPTGAKAYHRSRILFHFSGLFWQASMLAFFLFSGFSTAMTQVAGMVSGDRWVAHWIYFLIFFVFLEMVGFPFSILSGYFLEKKYNLSTQTLRAWLTDAAKKSALSLLLFVGTASFFFWGVEFSPAHWWIWMASAWLLLSVVLSVVFPQLILPLFYQVKLLSPESLRQELSAWCRQLHFPVLGLYEIALSQKTIKANAALTGFAGSRCVLLGDTLLKNFSSDEIKMVLAHEVGHHVKRHLFKGLIIDFFISLVGFYFLFHVSSKLAQAFGVSSFSDVKILPALSLLGLISGVLLGPFKNGLSRGYENEADCFAWTVFPSKIIFVSLMQKLSDLNLSNPNPSAWEEILLYDHPSAQKRIRNAEAFFGKAFLDKKVPRT